LLIKLKTRALLTGSIQDASMIKCEIKFVTRMTARAAGITEMLKITHAALIARWGKRPILRSEWPTFDAVTRYPDEALWAHDPAG
jgi:hypothetical protein